MSKKPIIVFEGIEGSGKTYHIDHVSKYLKKSLFKKPTLVNIHTQRIFWHAGAGKDKEKAFDRYLQQKKLLGRKADLLDEKIKKRMKLLWEKN